jgi:hypothetical protein
METLTKIKRMTRVRNSFLFAMCLLWSVSCYTYYSAEAFNGSEKSIDVPSTITPTTILGQQRGENKTIMQSDSVK